MKRWPIVLAAVALAGCAVHSNGKPVERGACPSVCVRFVAKGGQRWEASSDTYGTLSATGWVVGTCAVLSYPPGAWRLSESGDTTGCHEPEGWAVAP